MFAPLHPSAFPLARNQTQSRRLQCHRWAFVTHLHIPVPHSTPVQPHMGGEVSREKLSGTGDPPACLPVNMLEYNEWLSVSGVPVTRAHLVGLYGTGVRTIVTLTLTPLVGRHAILLNAAKSGPQGHEWTRRDDDMFDDLPPDLRFVHVPMPDAFPWPTRAQFMTLLHEATEARSRGARIHVHCWKGRNRSMAIAALLLVYLHTATETTLDMDLSGALWAAQGDFRRHLSSGGGYFAATKMLKAAGTTVRSGLMDDDWPAPMHETIVAETEAEVTTTTTGLSNPKHALPADTTSALVRALQGCLKTHAKPGPSVTATASTVLDMIKDKKAKDGGDD